MTMLRYNTGKVPLSLIPTSFFEAIFNIAFETNQAMPTRLIWQVGEVLAFGAQKYDAHNWRKSGSWSSTINSALRHLVSLVEGSVIDKESGLTETGHLGCNIAFLLEWANTGTGNDDTYKTPIFPFPLLNGEPAPGLVWVFNHLLCFRDTGSVDELRHAAYQLARYVEASDFSEVAPAAPPADPTSDPIWHEEAVAAFRQGASLEEIAQTYRRSPAAIQKLLNRSGCAERSVNVDNASLPFGFPSFHHAASSNADTRH